VNQTEAVWMAVKLWHSGFAVFCPHANTGKFERICPCTWQDYLDGDIVILKRCDAVYALPSYKHSRGSQAEIAEAKKHGIPVFYNIADLEKWADAEVGK
jgi:hypothetical protein